MTPKTTPMMRNWLIPDDGDEERRRKHESPRSSCVELTPEEKLEMEKALYVKAWLKNCEAAKNHQEMVWYNVQQQMVPLPCAPVLSGLGGRYYTQSLSAFASNNNKQKKPIVRNLNPVFASPPAGSTAPMFQQATCPPSFLPNHPFIAQPSTSLSSPTEATFLANNPFVMPLPVAALSRYHGNQMSPKEPGEISRGKRPC